MNAPIRSPLAASVLEGFTPEILAAIQQPGVACAVWRRTRDADFGDWIDALPAERLPRLRTLTTPDLVERVVHAACDSAGTPSHRHRERLASDAAALALILTQVARQPLIRLRLDIIGDAGQPGPFVLDRGRCRMVCAYRGAGLQYGATTPGGDNQPTDIRQLATADAALLRGALWPGGEFPVVLHRGAPFDASAGACLLLTMEPVDDVHGSC